MTTRNYVWFNNSDIANDLEWPLTAPSTHFCKFWGFCPFSNLLFPTFATFWPIFTKFGTVTQIGPLNGTESSVSQLWAFMFVVYTSNCHGQNCTRRAIFRLGIYTLIANILVLYLLRLTRTKSYLYAQTSQSDRKWLCSRVASWATSYKNLVKLIGY